VCGVRASARLILPLAVVLVLAAGCASQQPRPASTGGSNAAAGTPKRITASIIGQPAALIARMNTGAVSVPGANAVEQFVNGGMSEVLADGKLQPQLAEAVPSLENGLWKLLPDGRMELTWKIKPNAVWQDGTPITSFDFVFTSVVDQDPELPVLRAEGYNAVESVDAPDERTVVVFWKRSYIQADRMFSSIFASPIPRHILEAPYQQGEKTTFLLLPYWSTEFIGAGPFKVKEYSLGSHLVVSANDRYLLGRPKIDEIEIRFIPSVDTLMTNIIAGVIDVTMGRGLSIEQGLQGRDQWQGGKMIVLPGSWVMIYPQHLDPSPAIVGDVRFRRAMLHAIDRQAMVDTLQAGLTSVADVYLNPAEAEYPAVKDSAVRHEYDPRKAAQMIQELGYTRGSDGTFRDSAGQSLTVEIRSGVLEVLQKTAVSIADNWNRVGVTTEPVLVPPQRISDRPYMWTFPSFLTLRQGNDPDYLTRYRIAQIPLPENNFVGGNYGRYNNAEFDGFIQAYFATIPQQARTEVMRQIVYHISDQVALMGLFYDAEVMFLSNRMKDVTTTQSFLWDIHKWDVS